MPAITVRDISPELHEILKQRAARHHRSLNAEILQTLQDSVRTRPSNEEILAQADADRARSRELGITFTDEEITRYKNMGRL